MRRLVIVYNADAGLIAGALDSLHKLVSPATYPCSLCAVTHGLLTVDSRWRTYLASLDLPADVYHRADFRDAYPDFADAPLPLVGIDDGGLRVVIDAATLAATTSTEALIATLAARLA